MTSLGLASRLGRFERSLIREIHAAGENAYCRELTRRLGEAAGKDVTEGQVSRTLGVLKELGLVQCERRQPMPPTKHQRHRLVYSFTEGGEIVVAPLLTPPAQEVARSS